MMSLFHGLVGPVRRGLHIFELSSFKEGVGM